MTYHLVRTGDDARELIWSLLLTLDHGFHDTWVVASQVHEAVRDTSLT